MSLPGVIFGGSEALGFSSDTEYLDTSGAETVRVPHGDFLLSADFGRMGPHLSLSEGDTTVVVNYFTLGTAPDLTTESGHSVIDGSLAVKLAGPFAPGQFAFLAPVAQSTVASSIGTVEKLDLERSLSRGRMGRAFKHRRGRLFSPATSSRRRRMPISVSSL